MLGQKAWEFGPSLLLLVRCREIEMNAVLAFGTHLFLSSNFKRAKLSRNSFHVYK